MINRTKTTVLGLAIIAAPTVGILYGAYWVNFWAIKIGLGLQTYNSKVACIAASIWGLVISMCAIFVVCVLFFILYCIGREMIEIAQTTGAAVIKRCNKRRVEYAALNNAIQEENSEELAEIDEFLKMGGTK